MLEKRYKILLIVSLLFNCFTATAGNFTHKNVDKAQEIIEKVTTYYGGKEAIAKVDNIFVDYDYSINYRTQGYGYQDTDYHSNRPGNAYSLISYSEQLAWTQNQKYYLESFTAYTSLFKDKKSTEYNDITHTYTTKTQNNFDKYIEGQVLKNPLLIIKNILTKQDSLRYLGATTENDKHYYIVAMTLASGRLITTYIDQSNYQIGKVEFLRKGQLTEYFFSDYQCVGLFKLPFFIKTNMPENYYSAYFYYHIASYNFSPDVNKLATVPKDYVLAEKHNTYDGELRMQTIGKGIHWLTQNGANSLFVEFSDHIMAIDANSGRNEGLKRHLKKFRKLVPNKPIKYVSISHQHHDHMEQIPFYAKQGTTIITAKPFIPLITQKIKKTYDKETIKPNFDIVTNKRIYADETQRVEVYELKNMLHAETMLMTYFPNEQLIYLPDHYEEGYLIENHHATKILLAEIDHLGLKVKGFITGHGNDVYSLATIKNALAHPVEMKTFRRQPHQSVTHSE